MSVSQLQADINTLQAKVAKLQAALAEERSKPPQVVHTASTEYVSVVDAAAVDRVAVLEAENAELRAEIKRINRRAPKQVKVETPCPVQAARIDALVAELAQARDAKPGVQVMHTVSTEYVNDPALVAMVRRLQGRISKVKK